MKMAMRSSSALPQSVHRHLMIIGAQAVSAPHGNDE
jgi:hypothetical protein